MKLIEILILLFSAQSAALSIWLLIIFKRAKRHFGAVCIDVRGSIVCTEGGPPAIIINPPAVVLNPEPVHLPS